LCFFRYNALNIYFASELGRNQLNKNKCFSLLLTFLFLNVLVVSTDVVADKQYEILSGESLILSFSETVFSLMNIEIDNSISNKPFNFELKNQYDIVIASRTNYTHNLVISFVGSGNYTALISNINTETIEVSIIQKSFKLSLNDEIDGFSYKEKIYCWYFNSNEISTYKILPVESLNKGEYFDMYVIALAEDIHSNIWLSNKHPSEGAEWNNYLDPYDYEINSKKLIRLERDVNWIVYDIYESSSYDVLIFLKSTIAGNILITIVGISAGVVGIVIFVLYYHNPVKFRKRKVDGKSYDTTKVNYESPKDVTDTLRELLTSEED